MKIACILADDFLDSEFRIPYDRLTAAGHRVVIVGEEKGALLTGKQGKEKARVELSIEEADPDEFDALLIPGGNSPDHLRADQRFVNFARRFEQSGKLIAAVCHGPQILLTAGLVRGRRLTAWKTVQEDLRQAGALVLDQEVVEDRNWITSRQPSDLEAFSQAIINRLGEEARPQA